MFEEALRKNLYFNSARGVNSVSLYDLFTLPTDSPPGRNLVSLKSLAANVAKQVKEYEDLEEYKDLVFSGNAPSSEYTTNKLRLGILAHIVRTRKEEADNATRAAALMSQYKELEQVVEARNKKKVFNSSTKDIKRRMEDLKAVMDGITE